MDKKKKMILTGAGIIVGIIIIIILLIVIIKVGKNLMETRLKAPSTYYTVDDDYYFMSNNKIYYYNLDEENRGLLYSMGFSGNGNELISSSEKLLTPHFLFTYKNYEYCKVPTSSINENILKINLETGAINRAYNEGLTFNPNTIKNDKILAVISTDIEYEEPKIETYTYDLSSDKVTPNNTYTPNIDTKDFKREDFEEYREMQITADENFENCYYAFKNKIYKNNESYYEAKENINNLILKDEYIYFSEGDTLNKMDIDSKKIVETNEIEGISKTTGVNLANNKIIFNFDTNIIAKYDLGSVGIFDLENKKYKKYDNIKHYNVNIDEGNIYLLNGKYKVTKIKI